MSQDTPKPVRVRRSRKAGFRLQDASPNGLPVVYVGRPTKWGNPFDGAGALAFYAAFLWFTNFDLRELRGKNLACWCPLDQPCHADLLLALANDD